MRQVPLPLPSASLQAEEQALAARRDAAEMNVLKQQLRALQLAGGSGGSGGGKENSSSAAGGAGAGAGTAAGPPPAAAAAAAAAGAHHSHAPGGVVLQGQLCEAVQRLLRERELLLSRCAWGWLASMRFWLAG